MPQVATMITHFGETVDVWWTAGNGGQVRVQISSEGWTNPAYNAFALADEPGSLQINDDNAGDWLISYPDSNGTPVRYVCRNRVTWTLV